MSTFVIWKTGRHGHAHSRHSVRDLGDLQHLLISECGDRLIYLEAKTLDDDETLDSRLRYSPDDLTDDDFRWLTAPVRDEVRGVRA